MNGLVAATFLLYEIYMYALVWKQVSKTWTSSGRHEHVRLYIPLSRTKAALSYSCIMSPEVEMASDAVQGIGKQSFGWLRGKGPASTIPPHIQLS